jgi:hypothetical protein
MKFKEGDKVKWRSSSKDKTGEVVQVIPPEKDFRRVAHELAKQYNFRSMWGGGWPRDHQSYAVLVKTDGEKKDLLYWPRVSALECATIPTKPDKDD